MDVYLSAGSCELEFIVWSFLSLMEQPNDLGIISKTNLFFIRLTCKLTAFRCSGRNRHLLAELLCTLSNNSTCNYSLLHCIPHKPAVHKLRTPE